MNFISGIFSHYYQVIRKSNSIDNLIGGRTYIITNKSIIKKHLTSSHNYQKIVGCRFGLPE
jgi:hypothetical protein